MRSWPPCQAQMARQREDSAPAVAPALVLDAVYREHFDFVFRMASRLGGPAIDAEDAAQEVFLVVARKLDTFDGTSLVSTWLYGITLNIVRSMRRRYRLRSLFERDEEKADVPIESVDRAEVREAHRIAYAILEKIAPMTGTRTETVWSRLHYARKEFTDRLAKRQRGGQT